MLLFCSFYCLVTEVVGNKSFFLSSTICRLNCCVYLNNTRHAGCRVTNYVRKFVRVLKLKSGLKLNVLKYT
jgi:hypothetical protein